MIYCPFADCPAYTLLDGPETELWRSMREAGTLRQNLIDAGLVDSP